MTPGSQELSGGRQRGEDGIGSLWAPRALFSVEILGRNLDGIVKHCFQPVLLLYFKT